MENNNKKPYIPNRKGTKLVSLVMAGVIAISGTLVAVLSNKKDKGIDSVTTSVSDEVISEFENKLLLTQDFDINNEEAVRARAEAIYNISDKKYTVEDIMNMIYIFNGNYDAVNLGNRTAEEKFKYLQKLGIGTIFACNLSDDAEKLESLNPMSDKENVSVLDDEEIFAYMFMAGGKNKIQAMKIADVVVSKLKAIAASDTSRFEEYATKFFNLSKSFYDNKSSYSDGSVVLIVDDLKEKIPLMGLTKQQASILSKEEQNVDLGKIMFNISDKLNASINMEDCTSRTKNHEKHDASDKADAEKKANSNTKVQNTTKVIDGGGKKVKTETVTTKTNKPTTTVTETRTFVAPVPKTDSTTKYVPGGQVVGEKYVDADSKGALEIENEEYELETPVIVK